MNNDGKITLYDIVYYPNAFTPAYRIEDYKDKTPQKCYDAVDYVIQNGPTVPTYVRYFRTNYHFNVDGKVSVDAGNITCNGDIKGDVKCDCGKISCNNIFGNTDVDCGVVKSSKNSSECISNFIHKIFGE